MLQMKRKRPSRNQLNLPFKGSIMLKAKSKVKVTHDQYYRICNWMLTQGRDALGADYQTIATRASGQLKFPISTSTIAQAWRTLSWPARKQATKTDQIISNNEVATRLKAIETALLKS